MAQIQKQSFLVHNPNTNTYINLNDKVYGALNAHIETERLSALIEDMVQLDNQLKKELIEFKEEFKLKKDFFLHPSKTAWTNVNFETLRNTYTEYSKTYDISQNVIWNDVDKIKFLDKGDQLAVALQLAHWVRWRTIDTLKKCYETMLTAADGYKLYGDSMTKNGGYKPNCTTSKSHNDSWFYQRHSARTTSDWKNYWYFTRRISTFN